MQIHIKGDIYRRNSKRDTIKLKEDAMRNVKSRVKEHESVGFLMMTKERERVRQWRRTYENEQRSRISESDNNCVSYGIYGGKIRLIKIKCSRVKQLYGVQLLPVLMCLFSLRHLLSFTASIAIFVLFLRFLFQSNVSRLSQCFMSVLFTSKSYPIKSDKLFSYCS